MAYNPAERPEWIQPREKCTAKWTAVAEDLSNTDSNGEGGQHSCQMHACGASSPWCHGWVATDHAEKPKGSETRESATAEEGARGSTREGSQPGEADDAITDSSTKMDQGTLAWTNHAKQSLGRWQWSEI